MRCTAFISLLLLAVFACSCETDLTTGDPEPTEAEATDTDPSPTETVANAQALEALVTVNALRAEGCSCGSTFYPPAPELRLHPQLQEAAEGHSADQAGRQRIGHDGSDGSRTGERLTRTGFSWRSVAENVAWNQRSVAQVVNAWKNSEGHCRNIMNPAYEFMGLAEEDWYWTQVFAR